MKHHALAFVLTAASTAALADGEPSVADEARALIGTEYTLREQGQKITPYLSCTSEGGGVVIIDGVSHDDWAHGLAKCQGRSVEILRRKVGNADGHARWQIVDTLLLPPFHFGRNARRSNALQFADANECELKGRPDTYFIALVHWGNRTRVDWRTGVERAWTYDIERGRIVPLPARDIVCEWIEP